MAATVPERVVGFLKARKGIGFYDDCLQKQVGLTNRHQVQLSR